MTTENTPRAAFVGFGEAGQAFLGGWALADPARVRVFDIKTEDPATRPAMEARYAANGVTGCTARAEALAGAQAVFCVVSADQAFAAAEACAPALATGALWLDCNSCAPDTKRRSAAVIEAAGGRYVDVAVMSAVQPKRHLVPLLVAGPHAGAAEAALKALGMKPKVAGASVGDASAVKMIRSVMIKGIEALSAECFLAARKAGVEAQVLESLKVSDPDIDWAKRGAYNLERMMVHGVRRAAEMREVALTVTGLGLPGRMSAATAEWQDQVGAARAEPGEDEIAGRADRILARL